MNKWVFSALISYVGGLLWENCGEPLKFICMEKSRLVRNRGILKISPQYDLAEIELFFLSLPYIKAVYIC